MRVAVVSHLYDPGQLPEGLPAAVRAGRSPYAGTFVRDQATALAQAGVEVELLTPASYLLSFKEPLKAWREYRRLGIAEVAGPVRERFAFWPCRAWLTASPGDFWAVRLQARALGRLLDAGPRPDLIHAHFGFPTACFVRPAAEKRGIPYVVTVHESYFEEVARRPFAGRMLRRALAGAAQVLVPSKFQKRRVAGRFPELAGRTTVLPNGVDLGLFPPRAAVAAGGRARITFAGNLVEVKDLPVLFAAAEVLLAQGFDCELTVAGAGPLRSAMEERAKRLAGRARLTGALSRDRLAALLREGTDILVLSSRIETFGVVLVEALASGVPVVASHCGGPEDIVTDEVGRIVPPGDAAALAAAIREVWSRRAEFPPERLAGYARERFALDTVAVRLRELYNAALKGT